MRDCFLRNSPYNGVVEYMVEICSSQKKRKTTPAIDVYRAFEDVGFVEAVHACACLANHCVRTYVKTAELH